MSTQAPAYRYLRGQPGFVEHLGCLGLLWAAPGCSGLLCAALGCSGLLWAALRSSGLLCAALGCSGLLWACSALLWAALGCSGLLLAALGCSGLLWAALDYSGLFSAHTSPEKSVYLVYSGAFGVHSLRLLSSATWSHGSQMFLLGTIWAPFGCLFFMPEITEFPA